MGVWGASVSARRALSFGVAAAIGSIALKLALFGFGFESNRIASGQWLALIPHLGVPVGLMVALALLYGNAEREGARSTIAGLATSLFAWGAAFLLFLWIYHQVIHPDWFESVLAHARQTMRAAGHTDEQIDGKLEQVIAANRHFERDLALSNLILVLALTATGTVVAAGIRALRRRRALRSKFSRSAS